MESRSGKQASVDGFANEHIAAAILMKRYHLVSLMDVPLSSYDLLIDLRYTGEHEEILRAQVKTARTSVSFTAGGRGGVDREYKSSVKTYTYSTETSDVVIGIHPIDDDDSAFELYFVPTILIEELNKAGLNKTGIAINKIEKLRGNYFILENCKNEEIVIEKGREYGILPSSTQEVLYI